MKVKGVYYTITDDRGTIRHYCDGNPHCDDGPAVYRLDGLVAWWIHGKRHRIGGPAVIYGEELFWWEDGERHCLTGPACIFRDGWKKWYIKGEELSESEWNKRIGSM